MIGALRGKLVEKRPSQVLLDVSGVGYQVQIPLSTFSGLGSLHDEASLLIHTHLREDQIALYGFLTPREKHCFELLISASGVGPSLALKILSGISIDELVPAIRGSDFRGAPRQTRGRGCSGSGQAEHAFTTGARCGLGAGKSWIRRTVGRKGD